MYIGKCKKHTVCCTIPNYAYQLNIIPGNELERYKGKWIDGWMDRWIGRYLDR